MTKKTPPFTSPAFIVGKERSGTTLLSSILNRHPLICVTPETDFLYQLSKYPDGDVGFQRDWPKSLFSIVDRMNYTDDWNKPAEQVFKYLNEKPVSGKGAFIALGEVISKHYKKQLWIEKTPNHILCLPFIRQLFPNSPIIHIIRDGRDVSQSLMKVRFGSKNFVENLWRWMEAINLFNSFSINDTNNLIIKYEDLIQAPEKTVGTICHYLNIEFYPSMLVPDGSEKSLIDRTGSHMNQVSEPIDISKLANWKKSLPTKLQKAAIMLAHKELIYFGYENKQLDATKPIYISKLLLLSRHHRKLYDEVLFALANSSKKYMLESVSTLSPKKVHNSPYLWITDEVPLPDFKIRSSYTKNILFLIKLAQRLISLKLNGTQVIWILHPENNPTETWVIRKISEFLMSKLSTNIIVALGDNTKIGSITHYYHLNDKKCLFSSQHNFSRQLNELFA